MLQSPHRVEDRFSCSILFCEATYFFCLAVLHISLIAVAPLCFQTHWTGAFGFLINWIKVTTAGWTEFGIVAKFSSVARYDCKLSVSYQVHALALCNSLPALAEAFVRSKNAVCIISYLEEQEARCTILILQLAAAFHPARIP